MKNCSELQSYPMLIRWNKSNKRSVYQTLYQKRWKSKYKRNSSCFQWVWSIQARFGRTNSVNKHRQVRQYNFYRICSSSIRQENISLFRKTFKRFDINDNGRISADELRIVLNQQNLVKNPEYWVNMINEANVNGNGTISLKKL